MTRLGLIARADNRGLGQQTWAVYRHMQPAKTMVVDCPSQQPLALHLDRFPGAQVTAGLPSRADVRRFLDGVDVVYTAETGYTPLLWSEARRIGVKTVLHANYEFLDRSDDPSVWAAPSTWHLGDFPDGTVYLPVPIEGERFTASPKSAVARRWLHPVGRPAIHDRNGTADVLACLRYIRSDITLVITCQHADYVSSLMADVTVPDNVTVLVDAGDDEHYWDKYRGIDALVLPRRFGGLCLPLNEALGAGIPTLMPDISPNDDWLPKAWRIPAVKAGDFQARQRIDYYCTDPAALADRIDMMAGNPSAYAAACAHATDLASHMTWDVLLPDYRRVLCSS